MHLMTLAMRRFHIQKEDITATHAVLRGNEARHITKALRLGRNEQVLLFDNDGNEYLGIIEDAKTVMVLVRVIKSRPQVSQDTCEIVLAQAVIKSDKMNFIIQKCTELGITKIIPFFSNRTVPRWNTSTADQKLRHWQEVVIAAVKQSGVRRVPVVERTVCFNDAVRHEYSGYLKLILWEKETKNSLKYILRSQQPAERVIFMVGPEGGFTDDEIQTARANGFIAAGLGKLILRSETVPMTILSILRYEYGAME